jgi:hypothetical protein
MQVEANRSKSYIIPLLNEFIDIQKQLLVNSYLFDINYPEVNIDEIKGIFLLLKNANNAMFKFQEEKFKQNRFVEYKYDIDAQHYVAYVTFPQPVIKEVSYLLKSKYSLISIRSKEMITRYWEQSMNSKLYKILHKIESYKKELEEILNVKIDHDAELGSALDYHKETFSVIVNNISVV